MAPDAFEMTAAQFTTRIPGSLHRQLKVHCVMTEKPMSEFVEDAVRELLARQGRGGHPELPVARPATHVR